MAEGFARQIFDDEFNVRSAGIKSHGLNPFAVKAMAEIGVDISGHESKTIDALQHIAPDLVVTVCDHAKEACPVFPGSVDHLHIGFDDPPKLAVDVKAEEEAMQHYRRVRDDIAVFVKKLYLQLRE